MQVAREYLYGGDVWRVCSDSRRACDPFGNQATQDVTLVFERRYHDVMGKESWRAEQPTPAHLGHVVADVLKLIIPGVDNSVSIEVPLGR